MNLILFYVRKRISQPPKTKKTKISESPVEDRRRKKKNHPEPPRRKKIEDAKTKTPENPPKPTENPKTTTTQPDVHRHVPTAASVPAGPMVGFVGPRRVGGAEDEN